MDVVFAEVMKIHVKDELITPEGKLDVLKMQPIARMGNYDYTVMDNVFEMRVPPLDSAQRDLLFFYHDL